MSSTIAVSSRPHKRTKTMASSQNTTAERRASYRLDMMEDMTSKMLKMQNKPTSPTNLPLSTTQSQSTLNPWEDGNDYEFGKMLDQSAVATPSAFLPDTSSSNYGFPIQQLQQGASDSFTMGDFLKTGLTPYENAKSSTAFDPSMWDYFSLDDTHSTSAQIVAPQDLTSSTTVVVAPPTLASHNGPQPQQTTAPSQGLNQKVPKKRGRKRKQLDEKTQVEERKKFLERNRVAANRCRERKKTYVSNLEHRQKDVLSRNQFLRCELETLREEVAVLKQLVNVECACSEEILESNLREKLGGMGQSDADTEELVAKFNTMRASGDTSGRGMDVLMREIAARSPSSAGDSSMHDDLFSNPGDEEEEEDSGASADSSPVDVRTDGKTGYPAL